MIVVTACFRAETRAIAPRSGARIVRTGMGARAADDLARAVAGGGRVDVLLSIGFCGGLAPELRPGDLVIADEIKVGDDTVRVDPAFVERACATLAACNLAPRVGPVACTDGVADRAAKRDLAARGALSVDLESARLARWAATSGVPFLSLRVVLDPVEEEMPFSGRAPLWASAFRHPLAALRIGRAARPAARRLGRAVDCLVEAWEAR